MCVFFTKAAYQLTLVGLAVVVFVPQFEKPCCNLKTFGWLGDCIGVGYGK